MTLLTRRGFVGCLAGAIAAPLIVRPTSIMPVKTVDSWPEPDLKNDPGRFFDFYYPLIRVTPEMMEGVKAVDWDNWGGGHTPMVSIYDTSFWWFDEADTIPWVQIWNDPVPVAIWSEDPIPDAGWSELPKGVPVPPGIGWSYLSVADSVRENGWRHMQRAFEHLEAGHPDSAKGSFAKAHRNFDRANKLELPPMARSFDEVLADFKQVVADMSDQGGGISTLLR